MSGLSDTPECGGITTVYPLSADGQSGCFHFGVIMTHGAVSITCRFLCGHTFLFLWGRHGTEWLGQMVPLLIIRSLGRVQLFVTPWTIAHQASLSITNSRSFLKLKSIKLVMPCNRLILCRPLLLLLSIFPSIRVKLPHCFPQRLPLFRFPPATQESSDFSTEMQFTTFQ